MRRVCLMFAVLALLVSAAPAQQRMSPELLWKLGRVGGGDVSPDGEWVLYSVRRYDLAENKGDSDQWLVPLAGGEARALLAGPEGESDLQWVKLPGGKTRVFFTSKRGEDKAAQVYSIDPAGGELTRHSSFESGVSNLKVAPTGTHIAFTVDVKLDPTVQDLYPDLPKADARIIRDLLYRHWDSWHDYRYSHLHVAPLGADGQAGEALDLMAGQRNDCPVPPFGGAEQFEWSPDGRELAFTTKIVDEPALSTDTGLYVVSLDAPSQVRCVSHDMPGYDMDPTYSPDGRYLAWMSMERAGFESDRNRIFLMDRASGKRFDLTEGLDQTAHGVFWAPDGKSLYFGSEWRGTEQVFHMVVEGRSLRQVTEGRYNWSLRDLSADGKTLVVGRQDMIRPWEIGTLPATGGAFTALTDANGEVYAQLEKPTIQERWTTATDDKRIQSWVIYPPDFDPAKKWPLLVYCQGGPQGQVGQWFSYRWNFHLMAARGYVVLAVNRRGLPGFGRAWNDQISKDWGGQAMQDLLSATDDISGEDYVDPARRAAIGASFGGYTAYWMMGHHEGRFRTIVAHAGLFNLESFYGGTEELFFPNWDVGGPYWEGDLQEEYDRFSPHRAVEHWNTPLLIIHGEKDFRVPIGQAMEAFTAAKLKGVPVCFLYYPGEGHWVLGPQNGVLWHRTFFAWLDKYMSAES